MKWVLITLLICSFLVGVIFLTADYVSPHTVNNLTTVESKQLIDSTNNTYLNGNHFFPPFEPPNIDYLNLPAVYLQSGQGIEARWDTDISVTGIIFSQSQFDNFKSALTLIDNESFTQGLPWLISEARNAANKDGKVAFNATESGNYFAVVFYPSAGGGFVQVYDFNSYLMTYTQHTEAQNDNLYFYIGVAFIISGIIQIIIVLKKLSK